MAFVDHGPGGTGEPVAAPLRPGNAGSNTADDHITTARLALARACRWRSSTWWPPPSPPEVPPRLDDTQDAIEAASFYVRTATDTDGRRLYRFFHQSLTDHLAQANDADRRRLYEAVRGSVPGRDERGQPAWDLALPYVLRHAAQHAASAGQFDGPPQVARLPGARRSHRAVCAVEQRAVAAGPAGRRARCLGTRPYRICSSE